jgi:hypothetical protein
MLAKGIDAAHGQFQICGQKIRGQDGKFEAGIPFGLFSRVMQRL